MSGVESHQYLWWRTGISQFPERHTLLGGLVRSDISGMWKEAILACKLCTVLWKAAWSAAVRRVVLVGWIAPVFAGEWGLPYSLHLVLCNLSRAIPLCQLLHCLHIKFKTCISYTDCQFYTIQEIAIAYGYSNYNLLKWIQQFNRGNHWIIKQIPPMEAELMEKMRENCDRKENENSQEDTVAT